MNLPTSGGCYVKAVLAFALTFVVIVAGGNTIVSVVVTITIATLTLSIISVVVVVVIVNFIRHFVSLVINVAVVAVFNVSVVVIVGFVRAVVTLVVDNVIVKHHLVLFVVSHTHSPEKRNKQKI